VNDPHSRYASLVTNLSPRPCFTPTDRQFCHDLPEEQARYFSKNTREVLAINMGSFGIGIIDIPTARTALLGRCKQ
jgi:hypothetical protein